MRLEEKTLESRHEYRGRIISLRTDRVSLPGGREAVREIVEHPGAAAIVPVLEDGRIVFIRQYRKAVERFLLEIPAGMVERGEDPADCALRELEEETGYRAEKILKVAEIYPSPGYCDETIFIFKACGLKQTVSRPDSDESIEIEKIPQGEIPRLVSKGELKDAKTLAGLAAVFGITL